MSQDIDFAELLSLGSLNLKKTSSVELERQLFEVLRSPASADDEVAMKIKEEAIIQLSNLYVRHNDIKNLQELMELFLKTFHEFPKPKTAKIIKLLLDQGSKIQGKVDWQVAWCVRLIKWCKEENRTFLRQRIELRLINLHWQLEENQKGLEILEPLLKDIRKVDDKLMLVEIQLVESKIFHSLENFSKSKSSLTAARAAANAIYCPPLIQAELDLMSGILLAEDKDYKTSYSYFYESFEAFHLLENPKSISPLKYMILAKIMLNSPEDVNAILNGKYASKYAGRDLEAMKAIAQAHTKRSLQNFQNALKDYSNEIQGDRILRGHVKNLYENLLEQNLFRVVEPYAKVEIKHVAKLVGLPESEVQNKLSEMILDKKFDGTLDQGAGCLIIFESEKTDKLYETALGAMDNLDTVVDKLYEKAKLLKV